MAVSAETSINEDDDEVSHNTSDCILRWKLWRDMSQKISQSPGREIQNNNETRRRRSKLVRIIEI